MKTKPLRPTALSFGWTFLFLAALFPVVAFADAPAGTGFPIRFTLQKASYVTLVVEDANGKRVRNLVNETRFPAGDDVVYWDGYDEGERIEEGKGVQETPPVTRKLVSPGVYHVRGLVHDGIQMIYEFSVYSPGTPPWHTLDGSGAWLADHSPASDVLLLPARSGVTLGNGNTVPADAPLLAVCGSSAETGHGVALLDLDGKKLFGMRNSSKCLAVDKGPTPLPDDYFYGALPNAVFVVKVDGKVDPICKIPIATDAQPDGYRSPVDMAVWNGMAVVSDAADNALFVVDLASKQVSAKIPVNQPRGVAFDAQGRLLVCSGTTLKRYALQAGPGQVPQISGEETIVAEGLEEPRRVTVLADGGFLISDWGKSHQVKVFSADGRFQRAIGEPGGPQLGKYNERRMQHPAGTTVLPDGTLWVAEDDTLPKRFSMWKLADGTFERAIYGGPQYGGGGIIDPVDKTRFYYSSRMNFGGYGGIEFKLDWDKGTSIPAYIYMRYPEPDLAHIPGWSAFTGNDPRWPATDPRNHLWDQWANYIRFQDCDGLRGPPPDQPIYLNGRQYMVNQIGSVWLMDANHVIWPVSEVSGVGPLFSGNHRYAGQIRDLEKVRAPLTGMPWDPAHRYLMVWSDINGDHFINPEEAQIQVVAQPSDPNPRGLDFTNGPDAPVTPDLSRIMWYGLRLPVQKFDDHGVPIYDLKDVTQVAPTHENGYPIWTADGWLVEIASAIRGFHAGQEMWHIHRYEGRDVAVPQYPGQIIQCRGETGVGATAASIKPTVGEAGDLIALSSNKGSITLITSDGLNIQTLGADMRTASLWRMPEYKRGMTISGVSFEDEHFWPSIDQTADGKIYLVAGKEHSSILRLDGFETVKRITLPDITVTQTALADSPPTSTERVRRQDRQRFQALLIDQPLTLESFVSEVASGALAPTPIDNRASVVLTTDGQNLYAGFITHDPQAAQNDAALTNDLKLLFKHGGGLDLMFGSDATAKIDRMDPVAGDERLLVASSAGKVHAMLYCPVVPGTDEASRVLFESPIGKVYFDRVQDVSDQVQLAYDGKGNFLVTAPLALLGLNPTAKGTLLFDAGLLRGNGHDTAQRVYWNNLNTAIVSDVPSEARLQPNYWGRLFFVPSNAVDAPPLEAETPTATQPGLSYSYYEMTFSWG